MPKNADQLVLTTLRAAGQSWPCKLVERLPDRIAVIRGYPKIRLWTRAVHTIQADVDALADAIRNIADDPRRCLTTGSTASDVPLDTPAPRLKHAREASPATLAEAAAPWLPVDLDNITLSTPIDPLAPQDAVAEAVEMMGQPFANTSYVWQLTASADPMAKRLSARVFFIVDRDVSNAQRTAWARSINARLGLKFADAAIYSAAQVLYTANPEFRGGADPFPTRIGVCYGTRETLPWAEIEAQIATVPVDVRYTGRDWQGRTHRSITQHLASIGDGPQQEGFHVPIRDAIWQMVYHGWSHERIRSVVREAVWSAPRDPARHADSYLKAETSDRALGASIKGATKRIKIAEKPVRVTQTRTTREPVSLLAAQKRIRSLVEAWLKGEGPARLVIAATVGCGKTTATAESVLKSLAEDRTLLWAFPTHRQGLEVRERLNRDQLLHNAVRIRGRTQADESLGPPCHRPDLVEKIQAAGLARFTATIACKSTAGECPFFRGCSYYAQFNGPQRVRLVPHALLQHPSARAFDDEFVERCSGLVIDESPLAALTGRTHYALGAVKELGGAISELADAVAAGTAIDSESLMPRLEAEMRERCTAEIPMLGPGASDEALLMAELSSLAKKKSPRWMPLYRTALAYLAGDRNALWHGTSRDGPAIFCAWKAELPPVERVLVLDATADEGVYKALLGDGVRIERVDVKQNLRVIQASDAPVGKSRLVDPEGSNLLAQICALTRSTGAALITNKVAIEIATARGWLPATVETAHFNALRGLNALEGKAVAVIAGRPEPDPLDLEATARALWPRERLTLTGCYEWRQDGLASVASHADPRCDALLRMYREAEIAQAIGRLRAVRSEEQKIVILLTHTPVALPVESMSLAEILPNAKLARLFLAGDGVVPLVPELMVRMLPEQFPTVDAAKSWLKRERVSLPLLNTLYKAGDTLKFRTQGQRCPSTALAWVDHFDAWQKLEQLTGQRIVDCRPVDPDHATQATTAEPAAAHQEEAAMPTPSRLIWERPKAVVRPFAFRDPSAAPPPTKWRWERPSFRAMPISPGAMLPTLARLESSPPSLRRGHSRSHKRNQFVYPPLQPEVMP